MLVMNFIFDNLLSNDMVNYVYKYKFQKTKKKPYYNRVIYGFVTWLMVCFQQTR